MVYVRSGLTERIGEWLIRIGGKREITLVFTVTLAGAVLSLFMNNIAAASVLMPAIIGASKKSEVSASRLLMPMAFGTILGGMATLLTTTNILVSGVLRQHDLVGFGLLDFIPVGLPIVIAGILYIGLLGRNLLPKYAHPNTGNIPSETGDLDDVYHLEERVIQGRVFPGSPLVGVLVRDSQLREKFNLNLVAINSHGRMIETISPITKIKVNDVLQMIGRIDLINTDELQKWIELSTPQSYPEMDLIEMVLAPRSQLIGHTLRDAHFREKFGINVLAIWRAGRPYRTGHGDMPLQFGDALLLEGTETQLRVLQSEPEFLVLNRSTEPINRVKALFSSVIMAGTLIAVAFSPMATGEILLAGALVMVLFKVLDMDQAYRAVDWKSVFLIAGMLPLGIALTKTGVAELLSNNLLVYFGNHGSLVLLAGLAGLVIIFTQVMNGAAVAAIMAPIAIQLANSSGIDPRALAMAVALASSVAFITPLGHPVNVLVMGPGGYKFRDYAKVGILLTLLVFLIILIVLPIFWNLG